jgi:AcrR family transcriptional regulator
MAAPPNALTGRRLAAHESALPGDDARAEVPRRILHAAVARFSEVGFHGTSIRDLAEAAGVGAASLYDHFPSKEHLLAELVHLGHDHHQAALRRAVLEGGGAPADQLRSFVVAHVTFHAEYPVLAVVANHELHCLPPELAAASLALRSQSEGLLLDILDRGRATGDFLADDMFLVAAAIGAMGIRVASWIGSRDGYAAPEVAATYARFALSIAGSNPQET